VPVSTAYNQWTQFEEFPRFMGGVKEVTQLTDETLHWVAEIAGVRREWNARILEQVSDVRVAWAAIEGATNAGSVQFESLGPTQTLVRLFLEYEPEGLVERVGDTLNIVEKQAEADLARFKAFIEARRVESGAWRGSVNEGAGVGRPGVEAAAPSEGDSGKAGLSAKTVVAGAAAAAAGVAAASAALRSADRTDSPHDTTNNTAVTGHDPAAAAAPADEPASPPTEPTGKHRDA
jgi:Polyketide cyclase / dehydrase and lipid transport